MIVELSSFTSNKQKKHVFVLGNPRNKHALQPGHSLMDWVRLGNSGKDLTGVGPQAGRLKVSMCVNLYYFCHINNPLLVFKQTYTFVLICQSSCYGDSSFLTDNSQTTSRTRQANRRLGCHKRERLQHYPLSQLPSRRS